MPDTSNPLLAAVRDGRLPAFSDIRPGQVLPALEVLLEEYREGVKSYLGMARKSGWELVEAETAWADSLARAWSPVSHLNAVADSDELREVYNAGRERLTAHGSWRQQHAGLFGVYRALADDPGFPELDAARRRIVELELRDFHLAGVDLPPAKQAEYREIVLRLSKLAAQFSENLLDATRAWTRYFDTPEALDGLPETELELLRDTARQSGRDGWTALEPDGDGYAADSFGTFVDEPLQLGHFTEHSVEVFLLSLQIRYRHVPWFHHIHQTVR